MTSQQDALLATLNWTFDDANSTISQTNRTDATPLTPTITWTYDAAGRIASRAYLDDAGAGRTTAYAYDLAGNLISATDGSSTISIASDRIRRPTSVTVTGDSGATTTYAYSFTAPTRTDASGAYVMVVDAFGHLTSLTDPIHAGHFTWSYGADGQPTVMAGPNGNSSSLTYDPLGRLLTKVTASRASYTYAYSRAGTRLSEASVITADPANGTATIGYDPLGRLTSYSLPGIQTLSNTWQAVPNRDALTVNGAPTLQSFSAANRPNNNGYSYDSDGRLTARPGAAGGSLEWDSLGRLIRVRTSPGGAVIAQYTYDALDRLLTVDRSGTRIRFRYQGSTTSVAEIIDDVGGSVVRNVAVGPDGNVLEDWLGSSRRIYGTNGHGDTTWTADDSGSITATIRYDPWGNATFSTGTLPDWRFQGSWFDVSTNLGWAVARWYDPTLGAFASEDAVAGSAATLDLHQEASGPGGFSIRDLATADVLQQADQDPGHRHLYSYGQGDPIGRSDPNGRDWYSVFNSNGQIYTFNWAEKWTCTLYPTACSGLRWAAAVAFLNTFYIGPERRQNALRHCIWQCLLTWKEGWDWAHYWGTIHELYTFSNTAEGRLDRLEDLHNNVIGRLLGSHVNDLIWWFGATGAAVTLCNAAWNRGWLFTNNPGSLIPRWSSGAVVWNPIYQWNP